MRDGQLMKLFQNFIPYEKNAIKEKLAVKESGINEQQGNIPHCDNGAVAIYSIDALNIITLL